MRIVLIACGIVAAVCVMQPAVVLSPDSLIVNTRVSSVIVDGGGIAYAYRGITAGVDTTSGVWVQSARSSDTVG